MLEEKLHISAPTALLLSLLVTLVYAAANVVRQKLRIREKGGHGATCKTKLPLGLDFIYDAAFSQIQGKDILFWDRLLRTHGNAHRPYTVGVSAAGRRLIYTADPDNVKAILSGQFAEFGKGRWLSKEWRDLFGHSILSTDGQLWSDGRKMLRVQLAKEHISDLSSVEEYTALVLSALSSSEGQAIDVKSLFFKFTLDHGTRFLLGESTDTLNGNEDGIRFGDALDECQRFVMLQATTGKVGKLIPKTDFRKNLDVVNGFVDKQVQRALDMVDDDSEGVDSKRAYNLAHALVQYTRDPKMLRDQLLAALIGSRDTTACCLSWLFYALSQNPPVMTELREEILSIVGRDQMPTYTELKDMTYLQDTIKETLRLYPSIPYDIRWALKDTSLPRGGGPDGSEPVGILESTPIIYSIQYLHLLEDFHDSNDENLPDICSFVPRRWRTWRPKHWTYLPFNGGPRLCVGQQFALTEIAYIVVRILQQFDDISWMGEDKPAYTDPTIQGNTTVERFLLQQKIGMHSEIVLAPNDEVKLSFKQQSE